MVEPKLPKDWAAIAVELGAIKSSADWKVYQATNKLHSNEEIRLNLCYFVGEGEEEEEEEEEY